MSPPEQPRMVGCWTTGQIRFLAVTLLIPIALLVGMALFRGDYIQLLWTTPLGINMSIFCFCVAVVALPVFLGVCLLLNYLISPGDSRRSFLRTLFSVLLGLAFLGLFIWPLVSTVLVGPAAITMYHEMSSSL